MAVLLQRQLLLAQVPHWSPVTHRFMASVAQTSPP